jgi:hypothetical protein
MRKFTLSQSVYADQDVDRKALLSDPTRVLKRGCGCFDPLDRRVVAQRVQSGCHVAFNARLKQRELCFISQVGDVILKRRRDRRHHFGQPIAETRREFRDASSNLVATVTIRSTHEPDVRSRRCRFP